jgi:hypothetical protein
MKDLPEIVDPAGWAEIFCATFGATPRRPVAQPWASSLSTPTSGVVRPHTCLLSILKMPAAFYCGRGSSFRPGGGCAIDRPSGHPEDAAARRPCTELLSRTFFRAARTYLYWGIAYPVLRQRRRANILRSGGVVVLKLFSTFADVRQKQIAPRPIPCFPKEAPLSPGGASAFPAFPVEKRAPVIVYERAEGFWNFRASRTAYFQPDATQCSGRWMIMLLTAACH